MKTAVTGYPRIGRRRELKFATEAFFYGKMDSAELERVARSIRLSNWRTQVERGITYIPSNDFSLYDNMLDTAILFGIVPGRFHDAGLEDLSMMFALARGYQDLASGIDLKALTMRKWFNTNYHYLVPEFDDDTKPCVSGSKPVDEYREALAAGIETRPILIGPFTFLKLSRFTGKHRLEDHVPGMVGAYRDLLALFGREGLSRVQLEEPFLVTDLTDADLDIFSSIYRSLLEDKPVPGIHLHTGHGDIRDAYQTVVSLPFDGIGLDFVEGPVNLELIGQFGFPRDIELTAGIVSGKNIWRNDLENSRRLLSKLYGLTGAGIVAGTAVSLLHVPVSLEGESNLPEDVRKRLAFAEEKLDELKILASLGINEAGDEDEKDLFPAKKKIDNGNGLNDERFIRKPPRAERRLVQDQRLGLPFLPLTTIGSFPQTNEVRLNRQKWRKGEIPDETYHAAILDMTRRCIREQEALGFDVLVHGEYERNDMAEFFGENLEGFAITRNGWVQSYGTRCVKPPIIVSDIHRTRPLTVDLAVFAQSLTPKPVKGMLTGPVTILNWSFPREDISLKDTAFQLAQAIREEVLDLESKGIAIIQVDEAAFKEKLPLRKADRNSGYLDWAIPAFRLIHSGVRPETQIHTHMCYSDFSEIIKEIDALDADVITFEASRSNLEILDELVAGDFETEVGPGVYDIHSPRIPGVDELEAVIRLMIEKLGSKRRLWINPDCGLKTRENRETADALRNMVQAVHRIRSRS